MKSLRSISIVSFALTLCVAQAEDLKQTMQSMVDSYCRAALKKDTKSMGSIIMGHFAPDFHFVPTKGKAMSREAWMKQELEDTNSMKMSAMKITIQKVTLSGSKAVGITAIHVAGLMKMDPKSKAATFSYDGTGSMTMVKKNGQWWVTEIREKSGKALMNGKPMSM